MASVGDAFDLLLSEMEAEIASAHTTVTLAADSGQAWN